MDTVANNENTILQRARGNARMRFKMGNSGTTVLDNLYQDGCYKVRFPHPENKQVFEAVLINTAGGLTDGDRISTIADWQASTHAIVTTQAAERIYKSRQDEATLLTELNVAEGARASWIPQETILFNGGRYRKETNVNLHSEAEFFGVESLVFGRSAMGEIVTRGSITEKWKIHIDGELVFTDAFHVNDKEHGNIQLHLDQPAIANGASSIATLIYVNHNCNERLGDFRATIDNFGVIGGATCLGPLVVMRLLSDNSLELRKTLIQLFTVVNNNTIDIPRVWNC